MSDSVITVTNLHKNFKLPHQKIGTIKSIFTNIFSIGSQTYEIQHALMNISFEVKKGEFFGIVGRNGSGKSTLLKILANIYPPSRGSVNIEGRVVPFLELGVGFNGELTGRENVFLNGALMGFSEKEIESIYQDIVNFSGIERFMDQKLKNYSSGMQVRLAFSLAIRADADILLIDEVLAVGDADFQRKCFDYFKTIKKKGKTVVFVSHDMNAVREYCDNAILIEKNQILAWGKSAKVATIYSRMFMEQLPSDQESFKESKRWGDGSITYTKVTVPKSITDLAKHITFTTQSIANKDTVNPIFGFMVKNTAGTSILGTNTQIKKKFIDRIYKGEIISIEWTVPNVFTDGNYFIDPAILYNNGSQIADWWEEAAVFKVLKEERTPYVISPDIKVSINRKKSNNDS